jgi:hypothetical protein
MTDLDTSLEHGTDQRYGDQPEERRAAIGLFEQGDGRRYVLTTLRSLLPRNGRAPVVESNREPGLEWKMARRA